MPPRFYPIFEDTSWIKRALPLGVSFIQLRIKDKPVEYIYREIESAQRLARKYNAQLVINDYWQAAIELGCDWVHLGQEDLDEADILAIKSAGVRVGVSTHDASELERALSFEPDYIALGPVYPTILKEMKWAPQGLDKLAIWKKKIGDIPLIAIGGMSVERAAGAFLSGADCVCAVTDITLNDDPELRMSQWLEACG